MASIVSPSLSWKFYRILADSEISGLYGKACNIVLVSVPPEGGAPSAAAISDGLAVLTNKHPARGWEGPSMARGRFACPACKWGLDDDGCTSDFCAEGGVANDFAQLTTTRAAGRARQKAGMLHLFADKR